MSRTISSRILQHEERDSRMNNDHVIMICYYLQYPLLSIKCSLADSCAILCSELFMYALERVVAYNRLGTPIGFVLAFRCKHKALLMSDTNSIFP